jgi:LmbE family N-acetylglucosaminyl deacetylase
MPGQARRRRLRGLLAALADPARPPIDASKMLLVIAHPDDETIGCGGVLPRLTGMRVLLVTDGSPADPADAHRAGFADRQAYAAARLDEMREALALADVPPESLKGLGLTDQTAAWSLVPLALRIASRLDGVHVVFTHAYEGGHPDHDATAFAVHAASALSRGAPDIVEMPFYRATPEGWARQTFPEDDGIVVGLSAQEQTRKRRMIAAYRSQAATLAAFEASEERFRAAPARDFTVLPNGGLLLYERYPWGLDGADWIRLATQALRDLRLRAPI